MAKDGSKSGWKEFIWNPRTREFCGRTASSWGLILLFYLAFYIFLAGLFSVTIYVMLLTLDDNKPTYQDRLATPGMMIRPTGTDLEIIYKKEDTESWESHVQALNNFLSTYNDSVQEQTNVECTPDNYFFQEDSDSVKNIPKRSCQFKRSMLADCSGTPDRFYGYQEGTPCIIIKLNRVIGMLPGKDGLAPAVSCGPKKYKIDLDEWGDDSDKIGEVAYFPPNGTFNLMYFPYYGKKAQVNYSQPLVAVKFLNITLNTDVNVECKISGMRIQANNERDKFAGRVSFKLRINSNK
ncbi:sodium/potassium-transporting ATPase subunit beta-2b isoform X1 [Silurus meridionalis]|uniref:sodium/potassium-transporting ATPase subunit beta-2b isoform X1 n=1 Tax=Silurus meridionalis TaxID=175797 RepID=UPI001EEC62F1|nr:sodium/potassium-transporting ATPase subunit beta-2b isoform X1 [Silurus meridionalis]